MNAIEGKYIEMDHDDDDQNVMHAFHVIWGLHKMFMRVTIGPGAAL